MDHTARLIDALYVEAMVLADEARGYFDQWGRDDRDALTPLQRVGFSCESLKVTTRLMHVVAWLLSRRSPSGEDERPALTTAVASDTHIVAQLPDEARRIIAASEDLYARIARLDGKLAAPGTAPNAPLTFMSRLERAF